MSLSFSKITPCIWLDDQAEPAAAFYVHVWSGQSFDEPGLHPEGKFKAADLRITDAAQIEARDLRRWLRKAKTIQWDYKNIVKRRGVLEKLGDW